MITTWWKKTMDWVHVHSPYFVAAIFVVIAYFIRHVNLEYLSGDYYYYLRVWMQEIIARGGFASLSYSIGDYSVPYVFILTVLSYLTSEWMVGIKLVSIFFDFILAGTIGWLVYVSEPKDKGAHTQSILAALIVLFVPTVVMNSALWAQSDSIYTTFVVLAIIFLIKGKFIPSLIFYGIAFAFKLQAIFILPVYIIIYVLNRRYSIYEFLIIPLMYFVMSLPAIIAGRSIVDIALIYVRQTGTYPSMTLNMPNLYQWFPNNYAVFSYYALGLFAVLMAISLFRLMLRKVTIKRSVVIELALWSVLMAVFFLPAMHERYLYIADILSIAYYMIRHKNGWIPIMTIGISTLSYFPFLFGQTPVDLKLVSVMYIVLLYKFTQVLFVDIQKVSENPLEPSL